MSEHKRRKYSIGIVISDKNDKTRLVSVGRTYRHSLYDRVLCSKSKFAVHDEKNISHIGDTVKIIESRPLSKTKRWVLVEVVNKISGI
ncbi:MAG: 30S ribosomal protein S17 [Endomicrobium sp.]|jgi:small subunit ribosomal protein S17|nr:30S ribosomal protein S17 [Endomicrobium sp.]